MSIHIQRIHDVTILADNVEALHDFYARLGLRPVFRKGWDLVVFSAGLSELAIHAGPRTEGALVLALVVTDLSGAILHLQSLGIEFEGPMALRPGMVGVQFKDPNGNTIELLTTDP